MADHCSSLLNESSLAGKRRHGRRRANAVTPSRARCARRGRSAGRTAAASSAGIDQIVLKTSPARHIPGPGADAYRRNRQRAVPRRHRRGTARSRSRISRGLEQPVRPRSSAHLDVFVRVRKPPGRTRVGRHPRSVPITAMTERTIGRSRRATRSRALELDPAQAGPLYHPWALATAARRCPLRFPHRQVADLCGVLIRDRTARPRSALLERHGLLPG